MVSEVPKPHGYHYSRRTHQLHICWPPPGSSKGCYVSTYFEGSSISWGTYQELTYFPYNQTSKRLKDSLWDSEISHSKQSRNSQNKWRDLDNRYTTNFSNYTKSWLLLSDGYRQSRTTGENSDHYEILSKRDNFTDVSNSGEESTVPRFLPWS